MRHVLSAAKIIAQRHAARTSYERRVYLKLARAWLEAALVELNAGGWVWMIANAAFSEELDYQLATRYFASAFEHCERLPIRDQRSLLRDMSKRLSERLSVVDPEVPEW
jgi:hypothetical protein